MRNQLNKWPRTDAVTDGKLVDIHFIIFLSMYISCMHACAHKQNNPIFYYPNNSFTHIIFARLFPIYLLLYLFVNLFISEDTRLTTWLSPCSCERSVIAPTAFVYVLNTVNFPTNETAGGMQYTHVDSDACVCLAQYKGNNLRPCLDIYFSNSF